MAVLEQIWTLGSSATVQRYALAPFLGRVESNVDVTVLFKAGVRPCQSCAGMHAKGQARTVRERRSPAFPQLG